MLHSDEPDQRYTLLVYQHRFDAHDRNNHDHAPNQHLAEYLYRNNYDFEDFAKWYRDHYLIQFLNDLPIATYLVHQAEQIPPFVYKQARAESVRLLSYCILPPSPTPQYKKNQ